MAPPTQSFVTNELFRYVRIPTPRIVDLQLRAKREPELREILDRSEGDRNAWAAQFLQSGDRIRTEADLAFDYFATLTIAAVPRDRLPSRADLADPAHFDGDAVRHDPGWQSDRRRALLTALAIRIAVGGDGSSGQLADAGRILNFVELFPDLAKRQAREPFAPVVLERAPRKVSKAAAPAREPTQAPAVRRATQLRQVADGLYALWNARNRLLQQKRRAFDAERMALLRDIPDAGTPVAPGEGESGDPVAQTSAPRKVRGPAGAAGVDAARARGLARNAALRLRSEKMLALASSFEEEKRSATIEATLALPPATIAAITGRSVAEIEILLTTVKENAGTLNIPLAKFCEAYEAAATQADALAPVEDDPTDDGCFADYPELILADTLRILGKAELVRVDETFVDYAPGEISYVENVLAGEVRRRKVKSTRYFEESSETVSEETTDATKETSASTKQELKSSIETELSTRLQTDISASANASGGGTIGVVDVQGGGSVDASLGGGLDTSLSTGNESQFAQELVSKALERTKKTVIEKRASRSYSIDETLNVHEIINSGAQAKSFNGVYCFLNKRVAITESVYGRRLFLLANIRDPGRSLLCSKARRLALARADIGARPVFDIAPSDITPASYMSLAARFKAQNVTPPPPPVTTLAKTWKTDTTNANTEQSDNNTRKIAEVLVPYFERYKRFLITENLKLPDGYEVMEVAVTVNHGANGISIPADVPLRAGGALVFAAPALAAYGGYGAFLLPVWLWYVGFLASPLLHYNADSSNVGITVGNETQESPYYFFEPDVLLRELLLVFNIAKDLMPAAMSSIQANATTLITSLQAKASAVPPAVRDAVTGAVNDVLSRLGGIFQKVKDGDLGGAVGDAQTLAVSFNDAQMTAMKDVMDTFYAPFTQFMQDVINALDGVVGDAITHLLTAMLQRWDPAQNFTFANAQGARNELPVALNVIAIKPGVTVTMTACLRRTREALAAWQLETFATFYRAHLQLLADYESKAFMGGNGARLARPPAMLRAEEHAAVKERVLHTLNNLHEPVGHTYTYEKMNLFEHAIDWPNMSFRVFNYGPTSAEIERERQGTYLGVDERRRAFMTALWAQVMIPVSGNLHLLDQLTKYVETGTFDFDATLQDEELVALYRDFVLGRDVPPDSVSEPRFETIPTEFIVLMTDDLATTLPRNPYPPDGT